MSRVADAVRAVPGWRLARSYDRTWLSADGLVALTVWALLVPQALAYAQLGGFAPAVGLYAAVGALAGYALFGGVREMSVGPEATVALLTAAVVAPLAGGDASRYLALGAGVALLAGVLLVLGGLLRVGFVTRYLSRPLLLGYVTGVAVIMIISQLDTLLGITISASDDPVAELRETVQSLPEMQPLTLLVGLSVMGVALIVRRLDRRLPAYLIAVVVAIVMSVVLDLEAKGVAVVGSITPGLPPLGLPNVTLSDLRSLLGPAAAIGLLVYADSAVTGQVLARRGRYRVDADGEFFGLGASNIGASLTGGFPVNGSQSRSFTAADLGARSQLASVGVLVLTLLTLLVLTPLFGPLPKTALAAIIIIVAFGLIDAPEFSRLTRLDRTEGFLGILATVVVICLGVLAGILVVVILSLLLVAQRAARPRTTLLVRVPGTDSYRGPDGTPAGIAEPGLVIYRFDAPLFFANAETLRADVIAALEADPAARAVIIDMEGVSEIDSTATAMLADLMSDLAGRRVTLALARVKAPVGAYLARAGLLSAIGPERVFVEVDDAVAALGSLGTVAAQDVRDGGRGDPRTRGGSRSRPAS